MDYFCKYLKENFPIVKINLDDDQLEDYDTNNYFDDMRASHDLTVSTMERAMVVTKFKDDLTKEKIKSGDIEAI
jgi:hypothetical protein